MKLKQMQSKVSQIFQENEEIVTVDPKVMEPYDPIPGRVPRKVAIDRKRKEFASFSLEELLLEQVIFIVFFENHCFFKKNIKNSYFPKNFFKKKIIIF